MVIRRSHLDHNRDEARGCGPLARWWCGHADVDLPSKLLPQHMLCIRPTRRNALPRTSRTQHALHHHHRFRKRHIPAVLIVHVLPAARQHHRVTVLLQDEQVPVLLLPPGEQADDRPVVLPRGGRAEGGEGERVDALDEECTREIEG